MNFGVRLPGPFRVGISSKGAVNAGVTMGPFSMSTQLTQGQRAGNGSIYIPQWTVDAAAQALHAEGWKTEHVRDSLIASKGWITIVVESARGGVSARRVTSQRTVWTWTIIGALVFGLCILGAALN